MKAEGGRLKMEVGSWKLGDEHRKERDEVTRVGKLVTGLLNSTVRRRGIATRGIVALLTPISYLLTSICSQLR